MLLGEGSGEERPATLHLFKGRGIFHQLQADRTSVMEQGIQITPRQELF